MTSVAFMLWGLLFSSIGFGFLLYGKKQKHVPTLICGSVLLIYPYFITNTYLLIFLGVIVTAIPYFWRE